MYILIVDDDPDNRKLLIKILSDYGECEEANDGAEALEKFEASLNKQKPYDLVCMDIKMPQMDGLQALEQIRQAEAAMGIQLGHGTKVLMITGLDDSENFEKAFKENCESYLLKPFNRSKIEEQLKYLRLIEEPEY